MTVYCPKCASANLWPKGDPFKLDEEVDQVLMGQVEECFYCKHVWTDKWWVVYDMDGSTYTVDADEHGNAINQG